MEISKLIKDYLFNPKDGYYKTINPIGKNSDFITSPEISQTFGEITAGYLLNYFEKYRSPIDLVEIGAGKGTWLYDILNTTNNLAIKNIDLASSFIQSANLHIIEVNPTLQRLQQEKLSEFNISWHSDFDNFLRNISNRTKPLFVISNELFDCLPIDQYVKTFNGWQEITAKKVGDELYFHPVKIPPSKYNIINYLNKNYNQYGINSIIEYSTEAQELFGKIAKAIKSKSGLAITIDYGYLKQSGHSTLQAIKDHKKVPIKDIYINPEKCDLTSHVDFTSLDKIAKLNNLNSIICSQREFLISAGIKEREIMLIKENPKKALEISGAINRLIDNKQMGDLFKVHFCYN